MGFNDKNMFEVIEKNFADMDVYNPQNGEVEVLGLMGFYADNTYERFSKTDMQSLKNVNEGVTINAQFSSGGQLHFKTNSKKISVYVKLLNSPNMDNLSALAQCGVDLYYFNEKSDKYIFCGVSRFSTERSEYCTTLAEFDESLMRDFIINLPLYCGLTQILVGVDKHSQFAKSNKFCKYKRIIFYGTSIMQGASASRPGLCFFNAISRALRRECFNFGFSGNGLGEKEVIDSINKIENLSAFVIDYQANAGIFGTLKSTLARIISDVRAKYGNIPIVVASATLYEKNSFNKKFISEYDDCRDFQKQTVQSLNDSGDKNIYYVDGAKLFACDEYECTIDGTHPNDLGFFFMQQAYVKLFKEILHD